MSATTKTPEREVMLPERRAWFRAQRWAPGVRELIAELLDALEVETKYLDAAHAAIEARDTDPIHYAKDVFEDDVACGVDDYPNIKIVNAARRVTCPRCLAALATPEVPRG